MKVPSKREAKLMALEHRRREAFEANDVAAFAAIVAEREAALLEPHVFTCLGCGEDFEGDHIELLIASAMVIEGGETVANPDYGLLAVSKGEDGRKLKFCKTCSGGWKIPLLEYLEMR